MSETIPAFLAPMAGYSDLPFRILCHEEGASGQTTELVSATGIRHSGLDKSWRYVAVDPKLEGPVYLQLFGSEPDDFLYAADKILEDKRLTGIEGIDVNMGCPVPKVVKTGAGSALMDRPDVAVRIVSGLAKKLEDTGYKLSCKIRLGFVGEEETAPALAPRLVEAGARMLTVHGRFRDQYYAGQADWQAIGRVSRSLTETGLRDRVFLVGNGDIENPDEARRLAKEAGVDGVAIGRAAMGNPWIFRLFNSLSPSAEPTDADKKATIYRHASMLCEFLGEARAMLEFRKTLARYSQNRPNAKSLRQASNQILKLADVETWLALF